MIDSIIWIALTMSIGTAVLAVWFFSTILARESVVIGTGAEVVVFIDIWQTLDKYNLVELIAASCIRVIAVAAWIGFIVKKLRG